jgi:hypothetical protein
VCIHISFILLIALSAYEIYGVWFKDWAEKIYNS